MKTFSGCLLALLLITEARAQQSTMYNLDFEQVSNNGSMPMAWTRWGAYEMSLDTTAYSGLYSLKIIGDTNKSEFGGVGYMLPPVEGQMVRVEGYMKLKNVKDYAGLILRMDGKDEYPLLFSNMSQDQISGTRDWNKYSITLPYPEDTRHIVIGGVLKGSGEVWFDYFSVYVDDVNILELTEMEDKKSGRISAVIDQKNGTVSRKSLNYILSITITLLILVVLLIWRLSRKYRKQIRKRIKTIATVRSAKNSDDILPVEKSELESHEYTNTIIEGLKKLEADEEFLDANFSLQWVAKKIDTNTTYLSKTVNKHYKKSFREYTQDLRMEHVLRNIEENERFRKYSTKAMGESVGYNNPVSFSRAFKKRFGMTPSQYAELVNSQ